MFTRGDEKISHDNAYFAYLEPFELAPGTVKDGLQMPDKSSGLFRVWRSYAPDNTRNGVFVNLKDIRMPVDLVPKFGPKCSRKWAASVLCEVVKEFYVNHFFDKETFHYFMFP